MAVPTVAINFLKAGVKISSLLKRSRIKTCTMLIFLVGTVGYLLFTTGSAKQLTNVQLNKLPAYPSNRMFTYKNI